MVVEIPQGRGLHGRENRTKRKHAEETISTGVATVGAEFQQPFQEDETPILHAIATDFFEIKVAATGTVRKVREGRRNAPSIEVKIAGIAAPRSGAQPSCEKIGESLPARTDAVNASTLRTYHRTPAPPSASTTA
jgi:hypothetical protein